MSLSPLHTLTLMRCCSMEKDIFGFADAIQLDHLTDEQLTVVEDIFKDWK